MATVQERIEAGSRWLDANHPGWLNQIDVDRLNIKEPCHCVWGQLADGFHARPPAVHGREYELGFDAPRSEYAVLTQAWRDLIAARRADLTNGGHDFVAYAVGFVSASACTNLPDAEAAARMNLEHPTGITSRWEVADDTAFADGAPHPSPCERNPETHRHVLFNC